jgi:hypothetical protein
MRITGAVRDWTEILKNIVIVGGIVCAVLVFGISIYANVQEGNNGKLKSPSIEDARYEFLFTNTGRLIYTDEYQIEGDGVYLLKTFYNERSGKYRKQQIELTLDEKYFGEIIVTDRTKGK